MAASLASVADLAAFLQEPLAADDASALLYLRLASGQVRDYLGQQISPAVADDVLVVNPMEAFCVFLPEFPITAIALVETLDDTGTWSTADPATYTTDLETGQVQATSGIWPQAPGSWRITYSHGMDAVPDGISAIVLSVAARGYGTPVGIDNERIGQRSVKYATRAAELTETEQASLDRHWIASIA